MKITIVGAGFCGLATAWHLLNHPQFQFASIQIVDAKGIGGAASGIATGLLHPYVGGQAKLNLSGWEGFQATYELLQIASRELKQSVFSDGAGILRIALSAKQLIDFQNCALNHPMDVEWLTQEKILSWIPGIAPAPALWIKKGLIVYSSLYLRGLWNACQKRGAQFQKQHIHSLQEIENNDYIILTMGAQTSLLPEFSTLPLRVVKGQILELAWPDTIPPLPVAVNSQAYIVMSKSKRTCLVGATYEKKFSSAEPEKEIAITEIMPKAQAILPFLEKLPVVNSYAGLRGVGPKHLPFIHRFSSRHWILTGMGSKGLLYHALMSKQLVKAIAKSI
ncbi:NAD(P)/FAD-dependent oxidoreductase [Candidatus Protochlamydia amoebophila]|nr:FAD-dependent oxidoreductase [Candidatus Protochlamydia amoebophila]